MNRALHRWPDKAVVVHEAVGGFALVLTGHTPRPTPRWTRGNVLCIDTGVHVEEYGHLTVAEVRDGPKLHRIARTERFD